MSTHLESLHGALFTPLTDSAAGQVVGGAATGPGYATFIGYALLDGQVVSMYAWDPLPE